MSTFHHKNAEIIAIETEMESASGCIQIARSHIDVILAHLLEEQDEARYQIASFVHIFLERSFYEGYNFRKSMEKTNENQ